MCFRLKRQKWLALKIVNQDLLCETRFAHQDRTEEELDSYIHNYVMKLATACVCLRTFLLLNNVAYET